MDSSTPSLRFAPGMAELQQTLTDIGDKELFFIGGSPKSGTTWLQLLLDSHPDIGCSGETHFLDRFVPSVGKPIQDHGEYLTWLQTNIFAGLDCPSLDSPDLMNLLRVAMVFMLRHKNTPEVKLIGEKTPDNIRNLAVMNCLFPNSKFVHIVRDGRDAAMSAWFHNRRLSDEWDETIDLLAFIRASADVWTGDLARAQEFAEHAPSRYHRVRYEDLSTCPSSTLHSVLEFLGAGTDEAVIEACIERASFESVSGGRRAGQEDRSSFFRKGTTGDWRNHFSPEAEAAFNAIGGEWLDRLGYR